MKKYITIALLAIATLGSTACQSTAWLDNIAKNETASKIAWGVAKGISIIGLEYAESHFAEYADEISLAKEALALSYSIVFSDTDESGEITAIEAAQNIRDALAAKIADEDVLDTITAWIAEQLIETPDTPAAGPDAADYAAVGAALQLLAQ
jgi:hypothetical protein